MPGPPSTTAGCGTRPSPGSPRRRATRLSFDADYETVLSTKARRDRLDVAISRWPPTRVHPARHRLGCLRGIGTLTGFALAVEIGDWNRFTGATIGSFVGLVPSEHSSGSSQSQGSITKTGNTHARRLLVEAAWHHRRRLRGRQDDARPLGAGTRRRPGPRRPRATDACTAAGSATSSAARRPPSPTSPSPANSPAGAGRWPSSRSNPPRAASSTSAAGGSAWSDPRFNYEQPDHAAARSTLDKRSRSSRTPRPAVTNPRISV